MPFPFAKTFPCVRRLITPIQPAPVAGLKHMPPLDALFVPGCGYEEVQARRLRAAMRICTQQHERYGVVVPVMLSGTAKEVRQGNAYWAQLRARQTGLPERLMDDGGTARTTQDNGHALERMATQRLGAGSKTIGIVTGAWHMQRFLGNLLPHMATPHRLVPFRVGHHYVERHAGRAMGLYEIALGVPHNLISRTRRLRLMPYLKAMLMRSGRPISASISQGVCRTRPVRSCSNAAQLRR